MTGGFSRKQQFLGGGAVLIGLVALVTPFVVSNPTVSGLSPTVQASIVSLFLLFICIALLVTLEAYTERTTNVVLYQPRAALRAGLGTTLLVAGPYAALVGLTVWLDATGVLSVVLLSVLAVPLLGLGLTAIGVGLVATGRAVSEKEGLVLAVVAVVAVPIGAFPVPFAALGFAITVLGLGAIVRDLRYGPSELESRERESYGRQHRYL